MEFKYNEKVLVSILRHFDNFLHQNNYASPAVVYNDRDGDSVSYTGYGSRNKNYRIDIHYGFGVLNIFISKPKNILPLSKEIGTILLGAIGIPYFREKIKLGEGGRDSFNLMDVIERLQGEVYLENHLTEFNYETIIQLHKDFIQKHLMLIIRGEKWIDELIVEHKKKT